MGRSLLHSWSEGRTEVKDYILPLIFTKRLCDVSDDELNRIAKEVGTRAKAFKLVRHDKKLVRFYLPLHPLDPEDAVWSVIRTGKDTTRAADDKYLEKLGQELTSYARSSRGL
jgi:type I restriction enzyme M protein